MSADFYTGFFCGMFATVFIVAVIVIIFRVAVALGSRPLTAQDVRPQKRVGSNKTASVIYQNWIHYGTDDRGNKKYIRQLDNGGWYDAYNEYYVSDQMASRMLGDKYPGKDGVKK